MPDSAFSASQPKRKVSLAGSNYRQLILPVLIVVAVVLVDQLTKVWAVANLSGAPSLQVLGDFLQFTLVYNEGGAMGTRFGSSTYYVVMAVIVLPVLMIYVYRTREQKCLSIPLACIASGALGNLIDRIYMGKVVDFIDVDIPDITLWSYHLERFWIFNIADAAISCAIVFLLIYTFFFQHRHEAAAASAKTATPADAAVDNPTDPSQPTD